jgi:phage shock protein C
METRRLRRSRTDRMLGGVAGGLGEYLNIDPTIVRIVFVVLALLNGFGLLLYFVLWLLVPAADSVTADPQAQVRENLEDMRSAAESLVERIRQAFSA